MVLCVSLFQVKLVDDRSVLLELYHQTGGSNWFQGTGFLAKKGGWTADRKGWVRQPTLPLKEWFGVLEATPDGLHVVKMNLRDFNLRGT